jgi:hypothetical protein
VESEGPVRIRGNLTLTPVGVRFSLADDR